MLLIKIDPTSECVELIDDVDGCVTGFLANERYVVLTTEEKSGFFTLGGYDTILTGTCFVHPKDPVPLDQFRNRVQFIDPVDAAENVRRLPQRA